MDDRISGYLSAYQALRDATIGTYTIHGDRGDDVVATPVRGYRAENTIYDEAATAAPRDGNEPATDHATDDTFTGQALDELIRRIERANWGRPAPDEEFYETATGEIRHRGDEREIYMLNPWENTWAETAPKAYEDTIDRRAWWDWVNGMSITFDEKGRKASRDIAVPSEDEKVDKRYMEALADSEKKLDSFLDEFTVTDNA